MNSLSFEIIKTVAEINQGTSILGILENKNAVKIILFMRHKDGTLFPLSEKVMEINLEQKWFKSDKSFKKLSRTAKTRLIEAACKVCSISAERGEIHEFIN